MSEAIKFIKPVISLDACHLKSQWKGTLYIASALSPMNEICPIAFSLTRHNENSDRWDYFLYHFKMALPVVTRTHPLERVTFPEFSFISDRDKGLVQGLEKHFPTNHSDRISSGILSSKLFPLS
jgi:hypothetical protein